MKFSFAHFDMETRNIGGRLLEMGRGEDQARPGEDRARPGEDRARPGEDRARAVAGRTLVCLEDMKA